MAGTSELSVVERAKLENYETLIEGGLKSFVDVGRALMAIRDERLYKAEYSTFEAYCETRWGFQRHYANRLISSAKVASNLVPIGTTISMPSTESQSRPLASLPDEEQAEAWQEAVETAPEGKVTAKHVEKVVERRTTDRVEPIVEDELEPLPACRIIANLAEITGEKFGTIYADPPWKYGNQSTRAATDDHYDTLTVDELCEWPVDEIAAERSHLHLWTTNGFLPDAFRLIEAWGFEYKSCFVWVKTQMGIGNYWRVSHEFLLLGVRGGVTFADRSLLSWGEYPRSAHSSKPEDIRAKIERASPGPYLELFGRRSIPGWTVLGNDVRGGDQRRFA